MTRLFRTMNHQGNHKPIRVFLCHSSDDKLAVRDLYNRLKADGFQPWLDEEDLLPGNDWRYKIRKAVRTADVVLVCLSRNATLKRGFLQKEIRYALDVADEQPEGSTFLIPLRLEECEVPDRLERWHWVDFFKDNGYQRLLLTLSDLSNRTARGIVSDSDSRSDASRPVNVDSQASLPRVSPANNIRISRTKALTLVLIVILSFLSLTFAIRFWLPSRAQESRTASLPTPGIKGTSVVISDGLLLGEGAKARIVDGGYELSNEKSSAVVLVGEPTWSDYSVSVRAKVSSGIGDFGIVIGANDTCNLYHFQLHGFRQVFIVKYIDAEGCSAAYHDVMLADRPYQFELEQWYDVRVDFHNTTVSGYINGKKILEARDSTYSRGKAGLRVNRSAVLFKNFKITGYR